MRWQRATPPLKGLLSWQSLLTVPKAGVEEDNQLRTFMDAALARVSVGRKQRVLFGTHLRFFQMMSRS